MSKSNDTFAEYIADSLRPLGGVTPRKMFGGCGVYRGGKFFAIIYKSRLYFKTDKNSRKRYLEQNMKPFKPNEKQMLKNYFELPPDIIDNPEKLLEWAEESSRK